MNETQMKVNQSNRTKGTCPKCNRKSKKFASLLGRHFDYGKSCPNCRQSKDQDVSRIAIHHSSSMPPYNIPSTLEVPSSSCHESKWRGSEHQDDDNMTIISEITMDRALLEQKRTPLRPSVESNQQTSSSSSLFTPTTHLIGQEQQFAKSMETLTEESEDYNTQRFQHTNENMAKKCEEGRKREQEEITFRNNRVLLDRRKSSNSDSMTVEYTIDEVDKFNEKVQSLQMRKCSRSPSRSLPPPNNSTQFKSPHQQEERMSRSCDGDLHRESSKNQSWPEPAISDCTQRKLNGIDMTPAINDPNTVATKEHSASIKDIPIVLKCIEMYPKEKCVERGFQTLFLLATEKDPSGREARRDIILRNGLELLHDSLWRRERNVDCVVACFNALWALSFLNGNDEETEEIALHYVQKLGVLKRITHVLDLHSNVQIQEMGFGLLNRFLGVLPPDEIKASISVVLKNLPNVNASSDAFAMGMDTVTCLCQKFDDAKLLVAKHLLINRSLVEVLTDRSSSLASKQLICNLLWCVTSIRESISALSEKEDSITCHVIAVMKQVPRLNENASFHEATCGILANLAMLPANHVAIAKVDAVSVLYQEIQAFEQSEDVLSAACIALANFSVSPQFRTLLLDNDGIGALLFSMKSFPDSSLIQTEALKALCRFGCQSPQSVAPGINVIISAMMHHSDSRYIQKVACSILHKLSVDVRCRSIILSARGMFETLIQIQKRYTTDKTLQNDVISLLGNLSFDESIIPTVLKQGFIEATVEAMAQHQSDAELLESTCYLLWKLAIFSQEAKTQICSYGGLQYIVQVGLFCQ